MPLAIPHRLPLPRSLRRQFMLAISALELLILAGSLVAVYALNESSAAIRQLSDERLQHMENAQDVMQHTLLVERGMQGILNSDSLESIAGSYSEINTQLEAVDRLIRSLGTSSNDSAVLAIHQSGQSIRNATHILVRLKEDVVQADAEFSLALQEHTAPLLEAAGNPDLQLAVVLLRLREADDKEKIAALHKQFVRLANQGHHLPQQVLGDLQTLRTETADAGGHPGSLFRQRMRLIQQRAALLRFHGELQHQAGGMVDSARNLSARLTADYREATKRVTDASGKNRRWILTLLVANLVLAWLVSRYFLGRQVLNRLQQVSRYLRQGGTGSEHPDVPVRGSDEIGEMARAVEQFLKDRRQLAETNKELEEFSYSISHDLRIPLRAIDGFSHILLDEYAGKLDDEGKRLLRVVRDNTVRMGRLIDDMLQFSRTGRLELSFAEIDMESLAREVAEGLTPPVTSAQLQWEIGAIPPATGDRAMLRQVFVSLLSNAIKFSRMQPTPKIQIGAEVQGDKIVYHVTDNGVGFDMQYANKLFGVFQRLHSVDEFEGTGIGLAIVKRIVTRHGGRVWAEGKINEGATIYFSLPNAKPSEVNHENQPVH